MIFDLGIVAAFIAVLVIIFVIALLIWGLHYAIALAINSVIGFFALYAIKAFEIVPDLVINFWAVLAVAIGGIFGFALVLALHGLGVWF